MKLNDIYLCCQLNSVENDSSKTYTEPGRPWISSLLLSAITSHYGDVKWASRHLSSLASCMFVQQVQADTNGKIKAPQTDFNGDIKSPHLWPFVVSPHKRPISNARNVSLSWRHQLVMIGQSVTLRLFRFSAWFYWNTAKCTVAAFNNNTLSWSAHFPVNGIPPVPVHWSIIWLAGSEQVVNRPW